ncbi:hypothetical protein OAT08_03110 [Pelagibacteraceae bacterium]|jgi:hypothetical protein|nr:hypothetical protein [Pelagibacteraceae bacterium]
MKFFLSILFFLTIYSCSKPKTVLICGDHICINKEEAELYFEENLSIEVKIINKKQNDEIDLVELNLNNDNKKKEIRINKKTETINQVKVLSNDEILKIKKDIKIKKRKKIKQVKKINNESFSKRKKIKKKSTVNTNKINVNKKNKEVVDVCTIIKKCSIDEISKYILKQGNKKSFPDITTRE